VFTELAVLETKRGKEMRVDVEFTSNFAVNKDGDDNFGFSLNRTGEIPRIGIHVVNHDGFACGGRSTTDPLIERNACVRRHCAFERTEDEHVVIAFPFQHVEADPVVAG